MQFRIVNDRCHNTRRTLLCLTTILCSGLAAPAWAQDVSDIPPPTRFQVDENGVDLATGEHSELRADIAIGPSDPGGLAYIRKYGFRASGNNYDLGIFNSGGLWQASVGFTSHVFSLSGSTFTAEDGSGATLEKVGNVYTLTTSDGIKIVYDYLQLATYDINRKARATSIAYPTGEKISLHWASASYCTNNLDYCEGGTIIDVVRLQAVSSSLGYQLHFNYAVQDIQLPSQGPQWKALQSIQAINTSVDYCDPNAPLCTGLTQSWPTASYSGGTVTDPLGRATAYTTPTATSYAIRRPGSATDNFVVNHDANNKVSSITNEGVTWSYSYSVVGNVATMIRTDSLGKSRTITSDLTVGLPTSMKDELNRTIAYQYDTAGRLTHATMPDGNYKQYAYDGRGNITQTTSVAKSGSGLANIITSASYSASCTNALICNKPNLTTDAKGNVTEYTYDATHGGLLTVTAPAPAAGGVRPQVRYSYSALQAYYKNSAGSIVASGLPVYRLTGVSTCQTTASCANAADEIKTTIVYGATGVANNLLPTSVSAGAGDGTLTATTATTYDPFGNVLTVDGPLPGTADTARYRYDAARQVTGVVGPDPDGAGARKHLAQRLTYNLDGQVTVQEIGTVNSQSDGDWAAFTPNEAVTTDYDANARKVKDVLSSGGTAYAVQQFSYDILGRLDCSAQRMNSAIFGSLPASACTLGTAGSFGPDRITKNSYDAAGQLTKVTTGYGTAGQQRDDVTITYTNNGRQATVADAKGNLTTYEYDGFDRLAKTRYPSPTTPGTSSTTDYEQPTHDAASNIVSLRLRDGQTIGFAYDNLNRRTLKDLPTGEHDITYGYDNLGRMISANQVSQGHYLSYGYDGLGRNVSQAGPLGTMISQYDLAGRRTRLTWPDAFYVTYDYDVTGNMIAIRENGAASGIGVLATYAYDDLGRRTSVTRGNGTTTSYGYDAVSRLTSLIQDLGGTSQDQTVGLAYNPASQIASRARSNDVYAWLRHYNVDRPYTANGLNQLTTAGALNLTYDGRGNLAGDGNASYSYDSQNQLSQVSGSSSATLIHDPLGRLYYVGLTDATVYAYDGASMIGEYRYSDSQLLRRYVHGPGVDEPILWYEGSGTTDRRWLHADERGSVVAVTDAGGAAIAVNSYDDYGIPGLGNMGRFQYTGQAWLPEIGLYHYKARIYSATLGRFLQTDPIGYADGMNLYAYVKNDPVNFIDPSGLQQIPPIIVDAPRPIGVVTSGPGPGVGGSFSSEPDEILVIGRRKEKLIDTGDDLIKNKVQSGKQSPCSSKGSLAGKVADWAGTVSNVASGVAVVSGGAALVTSETVVGGIGFGAVAGGAEIVSLGASGVQAGAQYLDRNYGGLKQTLSGVAFSLGANAAFGRILAGAAGNITKAESAQYKYMVGVQNEAGSQILQNVCP